MRTPSVMRERVILHPGDRRAAVQEIIESARTRLALSVYRLDDSDVLAALSGARRRGVAVDVIVTQRVKGSKAALSVLVAALEGAGFGVRRYVNLPKYHAKYIVADDRLALVGSLNFTQKCFDETCDFAVLTRDREVTGGLSRLFEFDYHGNWSDGDFGSRLIVGPDTARTRFAGLLSQAKHSLRLIDHKLTDSEMLSVIRARAGAGVSVELLGRDEVVPLTPHGKLVIVDSQVAVIGSMSLSARSLDRRRELAIAIRDRAAIATLQDYFDGFEPVAGARAATRRAAKWTQCEAV